MVAPRDGRSFLKKTVVQHLRCLFSLNLGHHARNLNLGGRNHLDIDVVSGEGLEDLSGDAPVAANPETYCRTLARSRCE